jgi:hypothetical protein
VSGNGIESPGLVQIHKILAGLLDHYNFLGNKLALEMVVDEAAFFNKWIDDIYGNEGEAHWVQMLEVEYEGMEEVLFNLYAATGDDQWAEYPHPPLGYQVSIRLYRPRTPTLNSLQLIEPFTLSICRLAAENPTTKGQRSDLARDLAGDPTAAHTGVLPPPIAPPQTASRGPGVSDALRGVPGIAEGGGARPAPVSGSSQPPEEISPAQPYVSNLEDRPPHPLPYSGVDLGSGACVLVTASKTMPISSDEIIF